MSLTENIGYDIEDNNDNLTQDDLLFLLGASVTFSC
jgi:hypothetical protein